MQEKLRERSLWFDFNLEPADQNLPENCQPVGKDRRNFPSQEDLEYRALGRLATFQGGQHDSLLTSKQN